MPRFTIRDLLVATALIAVGAGMIVFLFRGREASHQLGDWPTLFFWCGSGAFVGAGIFTPFKRPWTGAITGFVIQTWLFFIRIGT
jgi:hypothetical protein